MNSCTASKARDSYFANALQKNTLGKYTCIQKKKINIEAPNLNEKLGNGIINSQVWVFRVT